MIQFAEIVDNLINSSAKNLSTMRLKHSNNTNGSYTPNGHNNNGSGDVTPSSSQEHSISADTQNTKQVRAIAFSQLTISQYRHWLMAPLDDYAQYYVTVTRRIQVYQHDRVMRWYRCSHNGLYRHIERCVFIQFPVIRGGRVNGKSRHEYGILMCKTRNEITIKCNSRIIVIQQLPKVA